MSKAVCTKCGKERELPPGKDKLSDLCADCMREIEFELHDTVGKLPIQRFYEEKK